MIYKDILDTGTMQGSYKDGLTLVSDEVGKLENQKIIKLGSLYIINHFS